MLGCKPYPRHIEQHDVYFGIGELKDQIDSILLFWPETNGDIHIDGWQYVTIVDDKYKISIVPKGEKTNNKKLFFINFGGYIKGKKYEEHEPVFVVAEDKNSAIKQAKLLPLFQHMGSVNEKARAHIDDKIAVDDIFDIEDTLNEFEKSQYMIQIEEVSASEFIAPDIFQYTGFLQIHKLTA